jgi:hypothetical protein
VKIQKGLVQESRTWRSVPLAPKISARTRVISEWGPTHDPAVAVGDELVVADFSLVLQ